MSKYRLLISLLVLAIFLLLPVSAAQADDPPIFTPTATETETPTETVIETPTVTSTDLPTSTATETLTQIPTNTTAPTLTQTLSNTLTPTNTVTQTWTPTFTPTPSNTITPTATATQTITPTVVSTSTRLPRSPNRIGLDAEIQYDVTATYDAAFNYYVGVANQQYPSIILLSVLCGVIIIVLVVWAVITFSKRRK